MDVDVDVESPVGGDADVNEKSRESPPATETPVVRRRRIVTELNGVPAPRRIRVISSSDDDDDNDDNDDNKEGAGEDRVGGGVAVRASPPQISRKTNQNHEIDAVADEERKRAQLRAKVAGLPRGRLHGTRIDNQKKHHNDNDDDDDDAGLEIVVVGGGRPTRAEPGPGPSLGLLGSGSRGGTGGREFSGSGSLQIQGAFTSPPSTRPRSALEQMRAAAQRVPVLRARTPTRREAARFRRRPDPPMNVTQSRLPTSRDNTNKTKNNMKNTNMNTNTSMMPPPRASSPTLGGGGGG